VLGSEERLIKLTLKGLQGPIEVLGKQYGGQVLMTPFEGLLDDEEVAAVLTFVRNSFGNEAPSVSPATVEGVREAIRDKTGFYTAEELLQAHPLVKHAERAKVPAPRRRSRAQTLGCSALSRTDKRACSWRTWTSAQPPTFRWRTTKERRFCL
jgi:hypothetical protein